MSKEIKVYLPSYRKPLYFSDKQETKKLSSWEILESFIQDVVYNRESFGDTDLKTIDHYLVDFVPSAMLSWGMKTIISSPRQYKLNFAFSMYNLDQASFYKGWYDSFRNYLKEKANYIISAYKFTSTLNNFLERRKTQGETAIAEFEDIVYVDNDNTKTLYENIKMLMGKFDDIIIVSDIESLDLNLLYDSTEAKEIIFPTKRIKLINKYEIKII